MPQIGLPAGLLRSSKKDGADTTGQAKVKNTKGLGDQAKSLTERFLGVAKKKKGKKKKGR